MLPPVMIGLIVVHVSAVMSKFSMFFAIPRLDSVAAVRGFLTKYRPFERIIDAVLWITGALLIYFTSWQMLRQTWMLIALGLYLLVFLTIRFALTRVLRNIAGSKKLYATDELARLRVNNWCVGIIAAVLLGIIAYLMMVKP